MLEKIKSGITKSVTTMNVTSSVYLETSKYKVMIENNEKANVDLIVQLGELAYKQWHEGAQDWNDIGMMAQQIEEKKEEIAAWKIKIQELESEKQLILNGNSGTADGNICSKCGNTYVPGAVFCGSCGNRIKI